MSVLFLVCNMSSLPFCSLCSILGVGDGVVLF